MTVTREEEIFRAGFALRRITPPEVVPQSGFAARAGLSRGVHDDLQVRAAVFSDSMSTAALVVLDLIGTDDRLTGLIRREVAARTGIPEDCIAVAATHTHGGPAVLSRGQLGSPPAGLPEFIAARTAEAVSQAAGALQPCTVRSARVREETVARNRRDPAGAVDHDVDVLRFDSGGTCIGLLVSYACHPVVLGPDNRLLTRDYPGFLVDALSGQEEFRDATVLFLTGAAGQLNTGHGAHDSWQLRPVAARTFREASRVGQLLASAAGAAARTAAAGPPLHAGGLACARREVWLDTVPDPEMPGIRADWEKEFSDPAVAPERKLLLEACLAWADSLPDLPARERVEVQAFRLGGHVLAFFPGEVFTEYGLALKALHGRSITTVAYANSAPGYIPVAAALDEGGYEVAEAHRFYGRRGPFAAHTEEVLLKAMKETVNEAEKAGTVVHSRGWLDIQVNGFGGIDFNSGSATPEDFQVARRKLRAVGVTRFLPTVITAPAGHMARCLRLISEARNSDPALAAAIPGIHLEGPFISPADGARGAHPEDCVMPPDSQLFRELQDAAGGLIRLVTLAPEQPGSAAFIEEVTAAGVRVAIGHSLADTDDIRRAVEAGAVLSTHLGNGLPATLARHPNPLFDQLAEPGLYASAIFDGHHLPDSVMKVMASCKQPGRLILTSDAVALAGMPAGVYEGQVGGKVELHENGRLTMYGSPYLAGSASSLLDGVNTALRVTGLPLADVLEMVTSVPESLLGLPQSEEELQLAVRHGTVEIVAVSEAPAD